MFSYFPGVGRGIARTLHARKSSFHDVIRLLLNGGKKV